MCPLGNPPQTVGFTGVFRRFAQLSPEPGGHNENTPCTFNVQRVLLLTVLQKGSVVVGCALGVLGFAFQQACSTENVAHGVVALMTGVFIEQILGLGPR